MHRLLPTPLTPPSIRVAGTSGRIVIIDFSHPSLLTPILHYAAEKGGIPAVLCTTGYTAEQTAELTKASETQPIFYSRNMSLGINLMLELAKKAAKVLGDQFDIEIVEKHHHNKLDAPSGTALMIADAINAEAGNSYEYVYDALRCARSAARRSWVSARCVAAALWVSTMCCSAVPRKC